MKIPLTERQMEILSMLGRQPMPSYGQIAIRLGLQSRATVAKHIAALELKGYLTRHRGEGGYSFIVLSDESKPTIELPPLSKRSHFVVPELLRWQIWERDNFTCLKCGARKCLTIDHIKPWQLGGDKTNPDNLQTLCRSCNSTKRLQTQDFRE